MRLIMTAATLGMIVAPGGCDPSEGADPVPEREIEQVQEAYTPEWMELPGVVGTGIGRCDGTPCIKVFLVSPAPDTEEAIPDSVEGHPVEIEVTGPVRPRSPSDTSSSDGPGPTGLRFLGSGW